MREVTDMTEITEIKNQQARELPADFRRRMEKMLGEDFPSFLKAFDREDSFRALRVNTLKTDPERLKEIYQGFLESCSGAEKR